MSSHASQAWVGDPVMCNIHGFGPCDCGIVPHRGCFPIDTRMQKTNCEVCDAWLSSEDKALERILCADCRAVIKSLRAIVVE